ncbi:zinc-dependent alcohol dehydrogenase [Propionibacteriaceae bacterium Y2011]
MAPQRRIVVVDSDGVQVIMGPEPQPASGEVQLALVRGGVCGSDLHAAAGRHPFVSLPYHPGHELVATITALGDGVGDWQVGDRVVVEPPLSCVALRVVEPGFPAEDCKPCRTGRPNLCERLRFFGCAYEQGGFAERSTIPANRLHHVPDDLTDDQAALIEPLSTPVHAAELAGPLLGRTVVIIGAGTIGLLQLVAARHAGATRIVVSDPLPAKRAIAERLGADAVVDGRADDMVAQVRGLLGESADVVFDCVAVESTVRQAIGLAGKGGTVVVVGVPTGDVVVPLHLVQDQQIRIQGSATYVPTDYDTAIEILRSGAVPTEVFVTGHRPLAQAADAFALAAGGDHVKVLLTP